MPRILVKSEKLVEEVNRKTGQVSLKQQCAIDSGGDYPTPFYIGVPTGKPYAAGLYDFAPSSFRANQFGGIDLNRFEMALVPMASGK